MGERKYKLTNNITGNEVAKVEANNYEQAVYRHAINKTKKELDGADTATKKKVRGTLYGLLLEQLEGCIVEEGNQLDLFHGKD